MVAGYAAKEFVAQGGKPGDLGIVSADSDLPYERPPLSKSYLAGKDDDASVLIEKAAFYREHAIDVRLNTPIERVELKGKLLKGRAGDSFRFETLVIATGARVRTLECPGATLDGVLYLRSLNDSRAIRKHLDSGKRAVIIGSGFIGMEVASQCAQKGLQTTLVFPEDRVGKRVFSPEISAFFQKYYQDRGVRLMDGKKVASIEGKERVEAVTLDSAERVPADMVIAGIGVVPETSLFENSGLKIDNGIVVNQYLETNTEGVLAAGDVANYMDVLFGKQRRVEHWDNATKQGQYAAGRLLGQREAFRNVPYFFSDVFDLSYEYWGDSTGADRVVHRGDMKSSSFSAWWMRDGRVVAAFVMNRPDDERNAAQKWIEEKAHVRWEGLADANRGVNEAEQAR